MGAQICRAVALVVIGRAVRVGGAVRLPVCVCADACCVVSIDVSGVRELFCQLELRLIVIREKWLCFLCPAMGGASIWMVVLLLLLLLLESRSGVVRATAGVSGPVCGSSVTWCVREWFCFRLSCRTAVAAQPLRV